MTRCRHSKRVARRQFLKTAGAMAGGMGLINKVGIACEDVASDLPLTELSAKKLARLIANRDVSAEEVAKAYLARIEEVNPQLNAIFQVEPGRILEEARTADRELAQGKRRGPLHGVPFSMKDQLETKGLITTNGCPELKDYVPARDATVVRRLKEAGAILLGKTNVPEMCHHGVTDNLVYGKTNNPYNLERTPGGSSGGEAAILAAGGSPVGIGTDIGGSIRGPSHFCGIAGIKPTNRRVPETGMLGAFAPSVSHWNGVGPMSRWVEDLELILGLVSGPDGSDHRVAPVSKKGLKISSSRQLKVAYFLDDGYSTPTHETREAVRDAAHALSEEGFDIRESRPDNFDTGADLWLELLIPSWSVGARYWQREYARMANTKVSEERFFLYEFLLKWIDHLYHNGKYSPEKHFELEIALERYATRMLTFMEDYDVLICPVENKPAGPHPTPEDFASIPYDGFWETVKADAGAFCMAFNVTGWPAAVVRAGTSPDGLPIGVQIAAKPWREDVALTVAQVIEERLGGWKPSPLL